MSMFDDIVLVCSEVDDSWLMESIRAADRLDERCRQYEALAPDWADAPEWAQWYTIDIDGLACWRSDEPEFKTLAWKHAGQWERTAFVDLPVGIDSRLCKWQRP